MRPELECAEERDPEHRQQRDAEPDPNATGAPRVPPQERRVSEREGRRAAQRPSLPARTSVTSSRESAAVGASSDHASRRAGWTRSLRPARRSSRARRASASRCSALPGTCRAVSSTAARARSRGDSSGPAPVLERESATTGHASHAAATRARSAAAKSAIAPVVGATRYVGDGAETSAGSSRSGAVGSPRSASVAVCGRNWLVLVRETSRSSGHVAHSLAARALAGLGSGRALRGTRSCARASPRWCRRASRTRADRCSGRERRSRRVRRRVAAPGGARTGRTARASGTSSGPQPSC